jgi:hypothetical protein
VEGKKNEIKNLPSPRIELGSPRPQRGVLAIILGRQADMLRPKKQLPKQKKCTSASNTGGALRLITGVTLANCVALISSVTLLVSITELVSAKS